MSANMEALSVPNATRRPETEGGWSSRMAFILAAAGSAIGLGNLWKFPYIAGEYGGGAFVLVYLACVAIIGLPILVAEILLGRRGGDSPVRSFQALAVREGHSPSWRLIGWLGMGGALLILSFYSVVAGWSVAYLGYGLGGHFAADANTASTMADLFAGLIASPAALIACHSVIMGATMVIVSRGIRGGLERAVRWLVPGLFVLLIALVVYAAMSTGQFGRAARFLFRPSFATLTWEGVLVAMGHAFFTLSAGMTVMMAYGSYLKRDVSIGRASVTIAGLDTLVAVLACLAIFPIVFANGLEPGSGQGLIFVTLPIAFSQMAGGEVVAVMFFALLAVAALSSTISILEPVVEHLERRDGWTRPKATLAVGALVWALGLGCALALNVAKGVTLFGMNFFDLLDFVTANIMLPLGGLLIAIYAGRVVSRESLAEELGIGNSPAFRAWRFLLRYVTPTCVALVLINNLF